MGCRKLCPPHCASLSNVKSESFQRHREKLNITTSRLATTVTYLVPVVLLLTHDDTTCTGVQWFMALVECNGERPLTLIKGNAMQERDRAVEGFMKNVEWLLWKLVGTAAAIE